MNHFNKYTVPNRLPTRAHRKIWNFRVEFFFMDILGRHWYVLDVLTMSYVYWRKNFHHWIFIQRVWNIKEFSEIVTVWIMEEKNHRNNFSLIKKKIEEICSHYQCIGLSKLSTSTILAINSNNIWLMDILHIM